MSSFSSICSLIGCKRKYILSRVLRKFIAPSSNLIFGSAFHLTQEKGLAEGIKYLNDFLPEEDNIQNSIELLTEMYIRQKAFLDMHNIEITDHEVPFKIQIGSEVDESFEGIIDGIANYKGGRWLVEFKTAKTIDVSHVPIDSQITAYMWACENSVNINDDIKGVLYIVNRKAKEKEPVILKNGSLSTAKNQGCSLSAYVNKALEMYGDQSSFPEKVKDYIAWLEQNYQPYIVMVEAARTKEDLQMFEESIMQYAEEEVSIKRAIKQYGVDRVLKTTPCFPNKQCFQFCDYKDICKKITLDKSISVEVIEDEEGYKDVFEIHDADI